jgi:endogenous inhibitor of DNA gyrase (YacG/DUF329 family)
MAERRPRFIKCLSCKTKVEVTATGRIPKYCSNACRQLAFARNARSIKVSAEDRQRLLMWELLQDADVVATDKPLPPRRKPQQE